MGRKQRLQFRRDLAATWAARNPVLDDGEPGWERDTGLFKIGDGFTPWLALAYASSGGGGGGYVDLDGGTASGVTGSVTDLDGGNASG